MENNQVVSFVVRCQAAAEKETGERLWRIKVTHVQEDRDTLFETIEQATLYMKQMLEDSSNLL